METSLFAGKPRNNSRLVLNYRSEKLKQEFFFSRTREGITTLFCSHETIASSYVNSSRLNEKLFYTNKTYI